MRIHIRFALLLLLAAFTACHGTPPPPSPSPSTTSSATRPSGTATGAVASPSCVKGWRAPPPGSMRRLQAERILQRGLGTKSPIVFLTIRYFEGPESPPSKQVYLTVVRRWYAKGYLKDNPSFRARFLMEQRNYGSGVVAVAPFGTRGYRSPDWSGFQYDTWNTKSRSYAGLPGKWAGVRYDFVTGGAGLDLPGLPSDVTGCLSGT